MSDVVGFNDNGFNKNQLTGAEEGGEEDRMERAIPIVSHSQSDYQPNYTTAVHDGAKIIIAAGFLLGDTVKQYATQYPNIKFAITDDPVAAIGGLKNEEGITYATQQGGCLVGVLAAKMAKSMGHKIIGVAGGHGDPAGRLVHRRLQVLRGEGRQGHEDARAVLERLRRRSRSARRSRRTRSARAPR